MKKFTILILILLIANACYSYSLNGFTTKFAQKFKNCDVYTEQADFNAYGTVFHDKKYILGWNGGKCGYKQITRTSGMTLYTTCSFSIEQVSALYNALLLQPRIPGIDNKTEEIWNKYVLDKNNCILKGENIFGKGFQIDEKYLPNF